MHRQAEQDTDRAKYVFEYEQPERRGLESYEYI